ncbi:hypothetical protein SD37_37935 [Amycolatopsis orientalis]|uniref:MmpS family membrane protein n=1 Tax=Amycolatopsis orientalis TaxID=31958 RepID=A0A193C910_AMYOR|nr:MmpS family transport accessory protein [Amycolatopsis orientalis]ANN20810.1 hypothetical protein SD37_37935 [Amycolatopsis orientalis]
MADRQLIGRAAIAGIVVAALATCVVLLNGDEEPRAETVAVVGEPTESAPSREPDRTITRTLSQERPQPVSNDWRITYELDGTGTATVVYDSNGLGLVHQEPQVTLPWRKELTWKNTGAPPTVQLLGQGEGAVECRVTVGGAVVTSQKSAPGEVATCAGRLTPS